MNDTRRGVLGRVGGAVALCGLGAFAGCLSEPASDDGSEPSRAGYAAFFALEDWTRNVAGDEYAFENPVPVGQIGHGFSPSFDLQGRIAETDAFVYLGNDEFRWAVDVAENLDADADVALIDVMDALDEEDLLAPDDDHGGHDHDDHDGGDSDRDGHDDHEDHDDDHEDHGDHGEHEHGAYDPHVWVDPVLTMDMVDAIAHGLAAVYPDDADAFERNAAEYADEIASVDEAFEATVADAALDVAVLAGHNSYRYLEARYGFEVHTPTSISPDGEPSHGDVADTIELVDERGVETILYDPFEPWTERNAEAIVEDSGATDVAPVSPAEGTLERWLEDDWGWLEQMTELNVPSFRRALGAE